MLIFSKKIALFVHILLVKILMIKQFLRRIRVTKMEQKFRCKKKLIFRWWWLPAIITFILLVFKIGWIKDWVVLYAELPFHHHNSNVTTHIAVDWINYNLIQNSKVVSLPSTSIESLHNFGKNILLHIMN